MKTRVGLAIAMLSLGIPSAVAAEMLEVSLGYSQVIGPVANMSTVIVGDDRVADATLGGGGTIILTGRTLGATNLIVLDEKGRELMASALQVVPLDRRPRTNIRIVGGISDAQDYVCGPDGGCNPVAVAAAASNAPTVVINGTVSGTPAVTPETPGTGATDTNGTAASPEQVSLNP